MNNLELTTRYHRLIRVIPDTYPDGGWINVRDTQFGRSDITAAITTNEARRIGIALIGTPLRSLCDSMDNAMQGLREGTADLDEILASLQNAQAQVNLIQTEANGG